MATLTTNISNVSLTVSGNTTKTATIAWTCPTVPAGMTITSCKLTGNASSFTTGNKGATLTINNTSVSSGSSFTINLGTGNNTTSVQASFVGAHKQTSTSVTLSNLVYTVEYTEPLPTYTVTFKDWDGSVLKTEEVESGNTATAPSNPSREGYEFIGWDKSFSNVTSDLIVTAQYRKIDILQIKENGNWTNINKVYKRVSGNWVEQDNSDWNDIFNVDMKYVKLRFPNPTAILYEDGTFIFSNYDDISTSHGNVIGTYTGWHEEEYNSYSTVPWYNNKDLIQDVYFNNINTISTYNWFYNTTLLRSVQGYGFKNTSNMKSMFVNCTNLTSLDVSNFNTSNVTNMHGMFQSCSSLTSLDVSNFDTSNVTNMRYMFQDCSSLTSLDLSGFDTSNVTNMRYMFFNCTNLTSLDVSNFDTSNVTDMENMFQSCSSLTSLDVSNFNTSNVTTMHWMFYNCSYFTSLDISNFNTSNVTDMECMFKGCSKLTSLDLSNFNTSNVTNMNDMFFGCSKLTSLDVSNFDTSNVTGMYRMFGGCSYLTSLDLSNFDVTNVTNMRYMFNGCTNLQTIYVKDETAKTKIEASTGFPTGVSVIIGKPN